MPAPTRRWNMVQLHDVVRLRGKRQPGRATVTVVALLSTNVDGPGITGDDGIEYRRFYWDIEVLEHPQTAGEA